MNFASAIVLGIIVAAAAVILVSMRKKKAGGCSSGCSGCAFKDSCGK